MLAPESGSRKTKRWLDLAFGSVLSVIIAPVVFLGWLAVRLTSRGPGFYTQTRTGYLGREFTIYKLRTMVDKCEDRTGPIWSFPGDPRVTSVGRVLRRFHVDELPQLVNVIRGEMSLVGPRPERPEFVEQLAEQIPEYRIRHEVTPGITGIAQLYLPPDEDVADVERKLEYDLFYARRYSPSLDIRILIATALKLLSMQWFVRLLVPIDRSEVSPPPESLRRAA